MDSSAAPQTAKTNGSYSWFVVFVLSFAGIVSYIDRQVINLLVEPIKLDLGINDTQISLVQGFSFAIFYAILSIPIARIADSGNRKHVIVAGIICWSLATFSCGLAVGFWTLFMARVFVGAGEATLAPAGYSMIGDYFTKERLPLAISVFTGSGFIGSGVALIIGAFVIDWVVGLGELSLPLIGSIEPWQLIFMLVALPSILLLVLFAFVKEPIRTISTTKHDAEPSFTHLIAHLKENQRLYCAIAFGLSLMAAAQFSIGAWVPSFFIRTYNWTASQIGVAFGVLAALCSTLGVLTGGWLSGRLIRAGVASANIVIPMCATLLCIPFAIAFPLASSASQSLWLLGGVLFFGAMPFGVGTTTLPQIAPNRLRAQVVAIYLLIANLLGFTLGPTSVALVTDFVFGQSAALRYSLSIVAPILMTAGVLLLATGLRPYQAYVTQAARPV